ncbi:neuronal acetylcholine receptor subunit alpha-9-II isoform X1 [Girardinichthys multiradiatus]|uniref:neuronal acetylcholine receptor subunit alpha-9-II isoform X1 n=1 Tax=Girardinichthys multiradiatus TaxID=208333 RepID=UPI001FABFD69|nr:neuronal acetylcholine receptor subunit alpha-9-II isoform X1 [Girardinichthys multiradiatus]
MFKMIQVICLTVLLPEVVHCAQGHYAQKLLTDLMENYSSALRPVEDTDRALNVTLQITLSQIKDMDERNQVLIAYLWIRQTWHDAYLRWNKEDYDGLDVIHIPSSLVWRPDLVLYNKADDDFSGPMDTNVKLRYNGEITWDAPAITKSSCVVDVSYFPFDSQECNLTFGSWTYNGNQVDIIMGMDSGDLSDFVENVEWECHGMPATKNVIMYGCCSDPYPDITYTVLLQRRSSFYIFNLLLPCFLISFLAPLGFYLPADSGEKVSLGVTVLLALTVFQLMVAESMPPSESVPLIGKYYIATMTMVTASTALTIFIMNIHFCGAEAKPVPHWAKVLIIDYMSKIFFVYEVGENCASGSSSLSSHYLQDDVCHKQVNSHIHANGKPRSHGCQKDQQSYRYPRSQPYKQQQQHRGKVQHRITREESSHLCRSAPGRYEGSNSKITMNDCCMEDQKPPGLPEDQKFPCCPEDKKPLPQGPTVTIGPCVFCSFGSGLPNVDTKLVRNVEYIANCFREQRATCAKGAEWKKIAKVMDRFFMWIFFVMVFLMSILVIGKAK